MDNIWLNTALELAEQKSCRLTSDHVLCVAIIFMSLSFIARNKNIHSRLFWKDKLILLLIEYLHCSVRGIVLQTVIKYKIEFIYCCGRDVN